MNEAFKFVGKIKFGEEVRKQHEKGGGRYFGLKFELLLIDMLQKDGVMDGLGRKGERER